MWVRPRTLLLKIITAVKNVKIPEVVAPFSCFSNFSIHMICFLLFIDDPENV